METIPIVLSILLALAFLGSGLSKLVGPSAAKSRATIEQLNLPPGMTPVIGLVEIAAAALLIAGVASDDPDLARLGAAVLVVTMVGAVAAHLRVRDSLAHLAPAAILGVIAVVTLIVAS